MVSERDATHRHWELTRLAIQRDESILDIAKLAEEGEELLLGGLMSAWQGARISADTQHDQKYIYSRSS